MLDAGLMKIVAIAAPWFAAILVAVARRQVRAIGFVAASVSVVASALALHAATGSELLSETLMVLFSCLTVVATLVLPTARLQSADDRGNAFRPRFHPAGLLHGQPAGSARRRGFSRFPSS